MKTICAFGSSPHTRGCPASQQSFSFVTTVHPRIRGVISSQPAYWRLCVRFIPACAGLSPCSNFSMLPIRGSSPHVRGYPFSSVDSEQNHSVHPRMCGVILFVYHLPGIYKRFIPACAGLSASSPWSSPYVPGSSPHVRGYQPGTG